MQVTSAILNCNTYLHQTDAYCGVTYIFVYSKGTEGWDGIYCVLTEILGAETSWQAGISMACTFTRGQAVSGPAAWQQAVPRWGLSCSQTPSCWVPPLPSAEKWGCEFLVLMVSKITWY